MKQLALLVSFFLVANVAVAKDLRWSLACKPDKKDPKSSIASYKLTKTATLNPKPTVGQKWLRNYVLEVTFKSKLDKAYSYPVGKGIDGDADYTEYEMKLTDQQMRTINVQAIYIQNNFEWANLIDVKGYSFADCR